MMIEWIICIVVGIAFLFYMIKALAHIWLYDRGWKKWTWNDRSKFPFFFHLWGKDGDPSRYARPNIYRAVRWELGWDKTDEVDFK